jgi:hypothetical protein
MCWWKEKSWDCRRGEAAIMGLEEVLIYTYIYIYIYILSLNTTDKDPLFFGRYLISVN